MLRLILAVVALSEVLCIDVNQEALAKQSCSRIVGNNIAKLVRAAFHDCVGGCNGCVDLSNSANDGLQGIMDQVHSVWNSDGISGFMSRADFLALCSVEALKAAHQLAPESDPLPTIRMKYGRRDCSCSGGPNQPDDNQFIGGHSGLNGVLDFYSNEFGFSTKESVAISGAHTLGSTQRTNSGFQGQWVVNNRHLNNQYYKNLQHTYWTQVDIGPPGFPRNQWSHGSDSRLALLNSDMCLVRHIVPAPDGSVPTTYLGSGVSSAAYIVHSYANNNAMWLDDFISAFMKMISKVANGEALQFPSQPSFGYGPSSSGDQLCHNAPQTSPSPHPTSLATSNKLLFPTRIHNLPSGDEIRQSAIDAIAQSRAETLNPTHLFPRPSTRVPTQPSTQVPTPPSQPAIRLPTLAPRRSHLPNSPLQVNQIRDQISSRINDAPSQRTSGLFRQIGK